MSDDHNTVSPYIRKHPLRDLCPECGERPAREDTGLCQKCELFANYERALAGED